MMANIHSVGQSTLVIIFMLENLSSSRLSLDFFDTGTRPVGNRTGQTVSLISKRSLPSSFPSPLKHIDTLR